MVADFQHADGYVEEAWHIIDEMTSIDDDEEVKRIRGLALEVSKKIEQRIHDANKSATREPEGGDDKETSPGLKGQIARAAAEEGMEHPKRLSSLAYRSYPTPSTEREATADAGSQI